MTPEYPLTIAVLHPEPNPGSLDILKRVQHDDNKVTASEATQSLYRILLLRSE